MNLYTFSDIVLNHEKILNMKKIQVPIISSEEFTDLFNKIIAFTNKDIDIKYFHAEEDKYKKKYESEIEKLENFSSYYFIDDLLILYKQRCLFWIKEMINCLLAVKRESKYSSKDIIRCIICACHARYNHKILQTTLSNHNLSHSNFNYTKDDNIPKTFFRIISNLTNT